MLAAALIGNLVIGWLLDAREELVGRHKSIGICILILALVRITNRMRLRDQVPPSTNCHTGWDNCTRSPPTDWLRCSGCTSWPHWHIGYSEEKISFNASFLYPDDAIQREACLHMNKTAPFPPWYHEARGLASMDTRFHGFAEGLPDGHEKLCFNFSMHER